MFQIFLVLLVFGLTIFNYNIHYPNLYAFGQEITEKKNYGKLNSYIEVQGQVTSMFAGAFMQFYYPELLQKVLVLLEYTFHYLLLLRLVNSEGFPYGCSHLFYWYCFIFID